MTRRVTFSLSKFRMFETWFIISLYIESVTLCLVDTFKNAVYTRFSSGRIEIIERRSLMSLKFDFMERSPTMSPFCLLVEILIKCG